MRIEITTTPTFDKEFKRLRKKYKSLPDDLLEFEKELLANPSVGIDLGQNIRKIRIAVKSKNKGKSSGARIITYTALASIREHKIILVTIYDKSETENISELEIKRIIASHFDNQ
jgi:mRNA-degrading endonuclease RelE of RelBE toxin-antitoxin system